MQGINAFSLEFGLSSISGALNETAVAASTYTILPTDNIVYVNYAGAVTLTLPASPIAKQLLLIKDISGAAATYNITVDGTIDGVTNPVIVSNYGGAMITYNGSSWSEHS